MLVMAVMALVGLVAGTSILIAILGFPFFVFALVAELTKLTPFFSNVVITSSVCETSEVVSSESPKFSAQTIQISFLLLLITIYHNSVLYDVSKHSKLGNILSRINSCT